MPQVLIMENVPQVLCEDFKDWQYFLELKGYSNYTQILNAKDYGIPQNRERCFMVSILGEWNYTFPQPIKLEKRLKNMLEQDVPERYFLSDKMIKYIINRTPLGSKQCYSNNLIGKECFRLMGVKDEDYNKLTCSNAQKYKQAGNSIVVQVLMGIFGELLGIEYENKIKEWSYGTKENV